MNIPTFMFPLFLILTLLFSPEGDKPDNSGIYVITSDGPAINWSPDVKLTWDDFKARNKPSSGFGIASTYSDFEYEFARSSGQEIIRIYVRFYCDKSWHNKGHAMDDVLAHEQLHFDINELFGRKFHRAIIDLKRQGQLSPSSIRKIYRQLQDDCNKYQDRYDDDSDHSTNGYQQDVWNKKVKYELEELEDFANYS